MMEQEDKNSLINIIAGLDVIYPKIRSELVDEFYSFPNDVLFFIWSGDYLNGFNYFWIKHKGKALPVTVRLDRKGRYYMTIG